MADAAPRRLIEVDLPIRRISEQARREKSIRHGHISTLHIWWARRPLASCRAVVLAGLLPDPGDPACPQAFRDAAAAAVAALPGRAAADDRAGLRQRLLDVIADFANWDLATAPAYLTAARALVAAAYPDGPPLVADPFAGGGAIPLEALRVGAEAWASDLNPVAVLLEKVVLEAIPRYGTRLADGIRIWGARLKEQAASELGPFYPRDPDGAVPIAYLWARTALCEGPACGARVPLMRALWLAKKPGRGVALQLHVEGQTVGFTITRGVATNAVGPGTVRRGALTCPVCGHTTPVDRIRLQARSQGLPEQLVTVVTTTPGRQGRNYRLPTAADLASVSAAGAELDRRVAAHTGPLSLVPDEPLPPRGTLGFRIQGYGMTTWSDLFAPRQLLALTTFARLVRESREAIATEVGDRGLADAITTCLGLAVDRQADYLSTGTHWRTTVEAIANTFGRQALPMVWDFPEANPFSEGSGNWAGAAVGWVEEVALAGAHASLQPATASEASATALPLADASVAMVCTDPPYYDAVPYADLSDFFYVWLRRSLGDVHPELLREPLTPKAAEIVVNPASMVGREPKLRAFFERQMTEAFREARRVLADDGLAVVVFAHKSTAGWEAMLQAIVGAGWTVTGSWPIDTEFVGRLRAMNSAALASSVHLVCRPRPTTAGVGDWGTVLRELPGRVETWMQRLAAEGVVGADAIFSCLGPAIELYSRYERVETAGGVVVPLGGGGSDGLDYLTQVWAAVARAALSTIFDQAEATGFDAESRLAAVWLWTVAGGTAVNGTGDGEPADDRSDDEETAAGSRGAPTGGFPLPYDTARKLAQPLGADLADLGRRPGAAFAVSGATARLVAVAERRRVLLGDGAGPATRARGPNPQGELFLEGSPDVPVSTVRPADTLLDQVHQAMLLFADDRGDAIRRLCVDDGIGADPRFWRLADALSKLYPAGSVERRWVDGVLARQRTLTP